MVLYLCSVKQACEQVVYIMRFIKSIAVACSYHAYQAEKETEAEIAVQTPTGLPYR